MTGFIQRVDLEGADLSGAVLDAGFARVIDIAPNVTSALNTSLPGALNSALPTALTGPLNTALPGALTTALPTALPAPLSTLGLTTALQDTFASGSGGAPAVGRERLLPRDTAQVIAGDRVSLQEDVRLSALTGRPLRGDARNVMLATTALVMPANLHADFAFQRMTPAASMTSGYVAQIVGNAGASVTDGTSFDWGNIQQIWLQQLLIDRHADVSKNVDGLRLGNGSDYIREMTLQKSSIAGFRRGVVIRDIHNYINTFIDAHWSKNWENNFRYEATSDSGERIVFLGGTLSDCQNPAGTGVAMYFADNISPADTYLIGVSLSYNDSNLRLPTGRVEFNNCHQENAQDKALITVPDKVDKKIPATVRLIGGKMVSGPNDVTWTGRKPESDVGRACFIEVLGARAIIEIDGTEIGRYRELANNTEIVRNYRRNRFTKLLVRRAPDTGFRNYGSGSAPFGSGIPEAVCYTYGNQLQVLPAGATSNLTLTQPTGGSVTSESGASGIYLNVGNGALRFTLVNTSSATQASFPLVSCKAGDLMQVEASFHVINAPNAYPAIRLDYYSDADGTVPITGNNIDQAVLAPPGGVFSANMTSGSNILTIVGAASSFPLQVGDLIQGTNIPNGARIGPGGTGTGAAGTYPMVFANGNPANATGTNTNVNAPTTITSIRTESGISASTATITIDDQANYPNTGTFRPGTLVSGKFNIGDDLSIDGIGPLKGRCFLTKDNGDGTWECNVAPDYAAFGNISTTTVQPQATIGPATFRGWRRSAHISRAPAGTQAVKVTPQVTGFGANTNADIVVDRIDCRQI